MSCFIFIQQADIACLLPTENRHILNHLEEELGKFKTDRPFIPGKQSWKINNTDRAAASRNTEAVIQMDENILNLIEEIELTDTTTKGKVRLQRSMNYSCPATLRVINQVEDLLCMPSPRLLPNYKNPCWNTTDGKFRCLPYFQIVGMDKCGSTDLFDRIAKHPDVLKNKGVLKKETMWWSWKRYGHWLKTVRRVESFNMYLRYFDTAAGSIQKQPHAGLITGDGTPMDLWDNSGWVNIPQNEGLSEPTVITPHLIKHVNPGVKLIIILRDPVERLFSDYIFLQQGVRTRKAFHEEVIRSIKELHRCTRNSSLRTCLYDRSLHVKINARIHLGFYPIFLKDWFRVFPREQFLILRTEDYSEQIEAHLKQLYSFLGLRDLPDSEIKTFAKAKRKYVTKTKQGKHMLPETRAILKRLYIKPIQELADLLNDRRFLWNTTESEFA